MAYKKKQPTELDVRARKSVQRFRAMMPSLNSYARAVSGNPRVKIEIVKSNGASTRDRIYFQPPIRLGDDLHHDYMLCDRRDQDGIQMCEACHTHESIMVVIYHEIGHIAKGTFDKPTDDDVNFMHRRGADLQPSDVSKQNFLTGFPKLWKEWQTEKFGDSYMALASTVTPFLPVLYNAIEDARVNEQIFAARRGVRRMYDAMMTETARDGIPPDPGSKGNPTHWRDAGSNYQMTLGVYMHIAGYDYSNWLQAEVVDALTNPDLVALMDRFDPTIGPAPCLRYTMDILEQLNKQGFCLTEEPDPQEEEEGEDGENSPNESGEESEPGDSGEAGDQNQQNSGSSSGSGGEGTSSDSESPGDGGGQDWSKQSDPKSGSPVQEDEQPESDESSDNTDEDKSGDNTGEGDSSDAESSEGSGDDPEGDPSGDDKTDGTQGAQSSSSDVSPEGAEGEDSASVASEGEPEESKLDPDDLTDEVDTGADKGEGGIKIRSWEDRARPLDKAEDMEGNICVSDMLGHGDSVDEKTATKKEIAAAKQILEAIVRAAMQEMYFETPSFNVEGVQLIHYGDEGWYPDHYSRGAITPDVTESVLSRATLELRVALDANRRADMLRHRKSGKINARVLGKRAPLGDERLFMKKHIPEKRDYFVVIGMDISYSTYGTNLRLMKQAVYAQAELCHRVGVPFAIYGHSHFESLTVYVVKEVGDAWDNKARTRLMDTQAINGNLDGHALEFLRKRVEEYNATDKIILYYSDGKMPASNHDEELEILQREIRYCRRQKITLLGVGIRTDSPKEHGLETVQVNGSEDAGQVVKQLAKHLVHR